jgi:hypothetical protein
MVAKDGVWTIWTLDRTSQQLREHIPMRVAHRHHRGDGDDRGDDREESKHRWREPRYQPLLRLIRSRR